MTDQNQSSEPKVGLFLARYEIGTDLPGAPTFNVQFAVSTVDETVNGSGLITQAVSPPLILKTTLQGHYSYMTIMPNLSHILITATGGVYVPFPPPAIGESWQVNVQLQMVIGSDWKAGVANYKYLDASGNWKSQSNVPVKSVPPNIMQ